MDWASAGGRWGPRRVRAGSERVEVWISAAGMLGRRWAPGMEDVTDPDRVEAVWRAQPVRWADIHHRRTGLHYNRHLAGVGPGRLGEALTRSMLSDVLRRCDVHVVLVTEHTARCAWVPVVIEIAESWGLAQVGVHVEGVPDQRGRVCGRGVCPFTDPGVPCHDYLPDGGPGQLNAWVAAAAGWTGR